MGGSGGGGGYIRSEPEKLVRKIRQSDEQTKDKEYEAEVEHHLDSLLKQYNDRNTEAINRHLEEIRKALEKDLEGTVDMLYGGSVAKHTYVDGLSDVDSLAVLDSCELADGSPVDAKEYFARRLRERFPSTDIDVGRLAVTVRFSDAEVQLLPAVSCRSNVQIPDASGKTWSEINPEGFRKALTRTNQANGGKVVPVIKLAKAIINNLPEKQRISGYHAESAAVEAFKNYTGEQRLKPMLQHYFQTAANLVRQPIRDRTGQSVHVDDDLGAPNSLDRRIVSDAMGRISRRMSNANNAGSVDEWRKMSD